MEDHVHVDKSTAENEYEIDFSFILAHLPTRERNAIKTLEITNVDTFCQYDFSQLFSIRGYGVTTVARLQELQKRIKMLKNKENLLQEIVIGLPTPASSWEQSVFSFSLNARERSALAKFCISNWKEFACFDFQQADNVSNLGAGTLRSLVAKQMDVREKIIFDKIDSAAVLSCDDEFSVFLLHWSLIAKKTLWDLGITRISELVHTDLTFLNYAATGCGKAYRELCQTQKDFSNIIARPDHVFLHGIPSYYSIVFRVQKNILCSVGLADYCDKFNTVKSFLSATFEDIMQLTSGNSDIAREIQSAQEEVIKICYNLIASFDTSSIRDENHRNWTQEICEETLNTLPFFNGKPNHCRIGPLHASFLPKLSMEKIVRGTLLHSLQQAGIFTFGDLLVISSSHLLHLKHCSKGKINGIRTRIRRILFSSTTVPLPLDKSTPNTFLISLFRNYIGTDRAVEILVQRMNGKTLECIAEKYGLTRERIRQLESKHKNTAGPIIAWKSFAEVRRMLEVSLLKLGGFAHIKQITAQFAVDNGWNERDCSVLLVRFLLESTADDFENHGEVYYAMTTYPCGHCGHLATSISRLCNQTNSKIPNRCALFSSLVKTCCTNCVESPQRLTESFMDWKCSSDAAYRRILDEGNLYRSKRSSMQRMALHILKNAPHPLNVREILAEIKYRSENEEFTERQVKTAVTCLCASNKDIFLWNRGSVYVHRKHIPMNDPIFVPIEKQLKKQIKNAKTPYISLYALFSQYQTDCETKGIPSPHALYACLKARSTHDVTFMRSPYISVTGERHKRRNIDLLEDWVDQKQGVVSTKLLKRYALEIGLNSHRYDGTVGNLKLVVRYEAGSVVHLRSLEWDQTKEETLHATALMYWKRCIGQGALLARTDDLLAKHEDKLPILGNGISWTSDLIFSLLSRSDTLLIFGNTYLAYGFPTKDCRIRTFGDIVVEVLKKKFGGRANLSELSSYFKNELRLLRLRLTPSMVRNYPGLVIADHEIYLLGNEPGI